MPIVFGAPLAAPVIPAPTLVPRKMTWTGFDGSVWDLSATDGPMVMAPGVKGLHMPPFNVFQSSTPLVPGVELTGYEIPARSVYWPINFYSESVDEWQATYAGFFNSIHPVEPGVWRVGEDDDARELPLTGVFDGSLAFQNDPFVLGWALIGVELFAPRPLWRGQAKRVPFTLGTGTAFIGESGGPPFHIEKATSFARAQIENVGDEPAYITWTLQGPLTDVTVGVGGALVDVPDIADGDVLVIDTDPASQYATLNGADFNESLGFQVFAPVPGNSKSGLSIAAAGTGTVEAALVPLFWRAF